MAKGAKKTSSPILASCQYLVYSEFILFKGTNFYHVNSASSITTFYHLRTDFDKLSLIFPITKQIISLALENVDTTDILKLFLNLLYILENIDKDRILLIDIFKIKLLCLLGYSPQIINCSRCGCNFKEEEKNIYYDYINNMFVCMECGKEKKYININYDILVAIKYISFSSYKKVFSIVLNEKQIQNLDKFTKAFEDCILNGI